MNRMIKKYFVVATIFLSLLVFVTSANAVFQPSRKPTRPASPSASQRKTKSEEGKMKSCQARENGIRKRSEHLTKMANNMLVKFDAIAQRVENYYTSKVVPGGKTVSNYDSLVSTIAVKKTAVQTALTSSQNDLASFNCTAGDPKGQMMQYKNDMKKVKDSLRDFRTAIKNLIVAVRSVNGQK